jgi:hypothetical protein
LAVRVRRAFAIRQIAIMAETQTAIAISGSMGREKLYQPRLVFLGFAHRQHMSEDERRRGGSAFGCGTPQGNL